MYNENSKKVINPQISVKELCYNVPSRRILNHASLHVHQNQFVGLIGPNGSGKTTLLKHIYRALPPENKTVFINGMEIERLSYRETAQKITVMKQENASDFDYTIMEMVLMGRAPYRKLYEPDTREDKKIAMDALGYVGMSDLADRTFTTLSGGEKQRVLIARSLTQESDILILDEPTNHLDVYYQWALMKMIKNLQKTVLSVFHDLNLACAFCDYLFVLNNGTIHAQGKPSNICTSKLFADVFHIDVDIITCKNNLLHVICKGALDHS